MEHSVLEVLLKNENNLNVMIYFNDRVPMVVLILVDFIYCVVNKRNKK